MPQENKFNLSIVIPVFNEEQYLFKLFLDLKKFFIQEDIEVIVVNDGSDDDSHDLLEKLKQNYFILIITFLFIYFFFNLLDGDRGLISYMEKKDIYEQLKNDQITLNSKIEDLEHKNSLLTENIDLDIIEILIREKFLFGKEGETTYIIKDNGNQK